MKNYFAKNLGIIFSLLTMLAVPTIVNAQYFTFTSTGDLDAGFRKTGVYQEKYEMVVYLGNITNFLNVPAGVTTNISNYTYQDLTNMCPDNFSNLQWSAFASFVGQVSFTNAYGIFPANSLFYTVPRTNTAVQSTPATRFPSSSAGRAADAVVDGIESGANTISTPPTFYSTSSVYNNSLVVLEPGNPASDQYSLTENIGDDSDSGEQFPAPYTVPIYWGDLGGSTFTFNIENLTAAPFTTATISDFYLNVPVGVGSHVIVDPLTGQTTGSADYLGYFTFTPSGTLSFTRASAVTAPAITSANATTATNGFAPLSVVFTNTATGAITNYVWNFGNGISVTNTTGASVTNTYTTNGNYTVTLTVYGPAGSATNVLANYIVASPAPKLSSVSVANGKLVLSGTNGPAGIQYRVLSATNLNVSIVNWTPVLTNTISALGNFGYTNNLLTNPASFFRLVSP